MLDSAPRVSEPPVKVPDSRRLRVLDLLRFCAALAVVLFHYGETRAWGSTHAFPALSAVTMFGVYGVRLFFIISGFVILMSAWGRGPGEFASSRIARLYPAYWASVITLGALAVGGLITDHRPTFSELLANLTMLQHGLRIRDLEIVYWTLWPELVFYVVITCFAAIGITYRRCLAFLGGWLFLLVIAERVNADLIQAVVIPFSAPYFIAGMALFLIHRFGGSVFPWLFVGVGWVLGVIQALKDNPTAVQRFGDALGSALVVGVVSLIFLVMILVALGTLDWVDWRWLTTVGALTYPLYLFHHHVGFLLIGWLRGPLGNWLALPVIVLIALGVAYAVHRFVETPMQPRLRAALDRSLRADGGYFPRGG
ncbi:acyltransferase [Planotetraspora sp. A-T 1434]|uniref:acyltransferase family protein n=1 Tax=Planotetraspora sp. A-T 1434 TaxID=2979219 RepID=UPI0021C05F6E|nr:acyltransferase [Planotetraspora sp. A-T 1434]MCT9934861.1 acyltransferase [Planotetraspora sp. A-T 1434]